MHVFVTGGTGTIGSAVVAELLANGHTVVALARSDGSAQAVKDAGAEALRGGLADRDVLRTGAAQSDGVIHLAFGRDYSSSDAVVQAVAEESAALAALGEELIGSDRPIVAVSGTPWVAGRTATFGERLAPHQEAVVKRRGDGVDESSGSTSVGSSPAAWARSTSATVAARRSRR